MDKWSK